MRLWRGRGQGTEAFKSLFIAKPRAGAVSLCDKSVPKQGLAYPKRWQGEVLNRRDPRKPPSSGEEVFQPLEKVGDERHTPSSPRLQCCFPGLEMKREKKTFCVSRQSLAKGRGEKLGGKKKRTTCGWSAQETFDFVFLAILFLGRKNSWGCSAEGTARSQEHPQPTQGPKFSWQLPAPRGFASKHGGVKRN